MSHLTPCNYCTLRNFEKLAKMTDQVVTLAPGEKKTAGLPDGIDVLMHKADEAPDREKHWVAWFMKLTDHCVCHE